VEVGTKAEEANVSTAADGERLGDDVVAEHGGAAGGRTQQRGQDVHERRLARAVRPEQAEDGGRLNLEVHAVEGDDVAEIMPETLRDDCGRAGSGVGDGSRVGHGVCGDRGRLRSHRSLDAGRSGG
jgi:hypothetical protein